MSKLGGLEALHICNNLGDHVIGHVYAKFSEEKEAANALSVMNRRYYDGRWKLPVEVEFSAVSDFRKAHCRDLDEDTCRRWGFCNFMHIKPVPLYLVRDMEEEAEDGLGGTRDQQRRREERKSHRREQKGDRERRGRGDSRGGGGGEHGGTGGSGSSRRDMEQETGEAGRVG
ncbi:LOW QUALITY PROTEIN: hypothetical protein ACHAWF_001289 [Thalassiosira exigua]